MTDHAPSGSAALARLLHGELWEALAARIEELHPLVWGADVPDDPRTRADGVRYLLRFLTAGLTICIAHDDTETPEFGRMIEARMCWGLDNPDCLYSYTRVRGDARYRLFGTIGSATHLEIQVNTGHYADGDFTGWRAVSARSGDELHIDEHGAIDVVLSAEPPAEPPAGSTKDQAPDWMRLDDTASFLVVRQYFGDWEHEVPAELLIEQIEYPYPPPPPAPATVAQQMELLLQWLDSGARCWDTISRGILATPPGGIQPFLPPPEASGLKGQAYGFGPFRCEPDEAVVLELDPPPEARLWSISLCDRFWQSIDFASRPSSLNGHQADLRSSSPRFVGVIAHDDPGIANWLDPGGHTAGTIAVRYLYPPERLPDAGTDTIPALSYRTVRRHELSSALPTGVAAIDPAARRDLLERRRRAVTRRYRR